MRKQSASESLSDGPKGERAKKERKKKKMEGGICVECCFVGFLFLFNTSCPMHIRKPTKQVLDREAVP